MQSPRSMAFDQKLPARIRAVIAGYEAVTEKRMFGGVAFLVNGNMAVTASSQGGILARVPPDDSERLAEQPGVEIAVMKGRQMRGWMRVAPERVRTKQQLTKWVNAACSFAQTLPKK
jgi:TfoX/Sxy family transcriptional regulator of competence genes